MTLNFSTYRQMFQKGMAAKSFTSTLDESLKNHLAMVDDLNVKKPLVMVPAFLFGQALWLISAQSANASEITNGDAVYEIGELFELGIQLSYLLLLGFLGVGTFFVIRQDCSRELDLSLRIAVP
ncbi:tetratricopeptide repeat domain-containing protein PYG7, chloroplastic-like [Hibiscus syriacus]|uniref:tetratricopeptide repeat domain-containing protein PYG7, chloroplastic-like n=1 Tax=Hibiscus syriacus TaxID=106335 RepID=UPI0019232006|nr:tetratricopeptide repeat domain-containing protein PYG7, chloroplastic-like [Hibiscus syriacus]